MLAQNHTDTAGEDRALPPTPARDPAEARSLAWLLLGLTFFGLYAFATLEPRGATWGVHALAYFPLWVRLAGLALCLCLLLRPVQERATAALRFALQPVLQRSVPGRWFPVALGVVAFALYYSFPIRTVVYGDSRTILHWWADNSTVPTAWFARIFDVHLLASKEVLTILLHRTVAHLFSIPIGEAYRIMSALSGALCLCLWFHFVRSEFSRSRWGPVLLVVGCVLGSHQIFFGHVENYAFVFLTSLAFLLIGSRMLDGRASFATVVLLFLLMIKAHAVTIFMAPAFLILVAYRLARRFPSMLGLLRWNRLIALLVVPSLVAGAILYFFYFKSFNEPHAGDNRAFQQTFLPIVAPPPPLQYSLQSTDHLLDLGNVLLLVGTPLLIALLGVVLLHRRAIAWRRPRVVFASFALGYPLLFFIALNPALSMPRDWDLYGLLGGPLLLFFATVLAHGDERVQSAPVHGTVFAFAVFSLGFYALNASPARLSHRLEDVGEHVYRTFHTSAGFLIGSAQEMETDPDKALARRLATVRRLAPAVVGEDDEYAHLLVILAATYRERGDLGQAVSWIDQAAKAAPGDQNIALWRNDYLLWAGQAERARRSIDALLARNPRNLDALIQGAMAAAQQGDFAAGLEYLERARAVAPDDREVLAWTEQFKTRADAPDPSVRRRVLSPEVRPAGY